MKRGKLIKYSRLWKKANKRYYYFKHIASNGETIFSSPAYKSRQGRNKMVNKLAIIHKAKIETE